MSPSSSIGHYRIVSKLGEGGMGAVYRATDTRLNREVAIKVLPAAVASDPDRLVRFTREAQVLASLNHPNIAAVYGVEEHAIVMELVEGQPPAGPLSSEAALPLIRQLIDALEYAHEKGVVHRDLKPANLKITPEGRLKVLDFGLAKALSADAANTGDPTSSPTVTMHGTMAGMIMGTAAYMSPEQARGQKVDKRSDIWSFGVVFYELLTGRNLFGCETISDTLAAVLKTDPDWSALPLDTPPGIRRLLRHCLDRDRKRRLADIADARLEMDEALSGPELPVPAAALPARAAFRWWNAAVALVALAGLALAVVHFRETPPQPAAMRFQIPAPEKTNFGITGMALSPDGRQLAFIAGGVDGRPMLWVRPLDSVTAHALPGTEGAGYLPFWSPDSRFIGFLVQGKVKKIDAAGGLPQPLCEVPGDLVGGSWSRDGVIIFGSASSGLFRVSQAGGVAAGLTTPDKAHGERGHLRPWFLPDGRHFLYFSRAGQEAIGIYLATLDGPERKRLATTGQAGAYAPPAAGSENGHLLFLREGTLMALPLDARRFEPAGEPFPLAEQIGSLLAMGFFSVSANGVLAYRNGASSAGVTQLAWFDRQGKSLGVLGPPGVYSSPELSPDGSRAAVDQLDTGTAATQNVLLMDVARGVPMKFTFDLGQDFGATWSPDGTRLAFTSIRGAEIGMYQKDSGGTGKEELLLKSDLNVVPNSWSPDGRYLLYSATSPKTGNDLWVLPASAGTTPGGKPVSYLQEPYNERQGQFSPDGRWIAYSSDESGIYQVYVQSFPAGAGKFQVSTSGGSQPRWRRDGKEIFYIGADGRLTAVDVKKEARFGAGAPHPLFDAQIPSGGPGTAVYGTFDYDVTADGKRFLASSVAIDRANAAPTPITVIVNWTAALKR